MEPAFWYLLAILILVVVGGLFVASHKKWLNTMAKTKLIVKDNQVLVDADVLFEQIEEAGGDWKKVRESYQQLKSSLQTGDED